MPTPFRKPVVESVNGNPRCPINAKWPLPYFSSHDGRGLVRLYHGHVTDVLETLPEKSIHCVVTSPPFWGLRSYLDNKHEDKIYEIGSEPSPDCGSWLGKLSADVIYQLVVPIIEEQGTRPEFAAKMVADILVSAQTKRGPCGRCFVCSMRIVFKRIKRVLRDDGTLWLNLGDTFSSGCMSGKQGPNSMFGTSSKNSQLGIKIPSRKTEGLTDGNLVGIPWRVALALQADGWVLRSDIPWVKRASMPESANNRPNKALEYVFMFTKGMDYYFDMEAVKKPHARIWDTSNGGNLSGDEGLKLHDGISKEVKRKYPLPDPSGRHFRNADLWFSSVNKRGLVGIGDELVGLDVSSGNYAGSHFAVFDPSLIEPLIKCSTSEKGCCPQCGNPWKRILKGKPSDRVDRASKTDTSFGPNSSQTHRPNGSEYAKSKAENPTKTLGWHPTCRCGVGKTPAPCIVLDPFMGSGTVGEVCLKLGRAAIGIDLSEEYIKVNQITRINRAWHQYQMPREVHKGLFG